MSTSEAVRMWEETVKIPAYGVGAPDPNPMFLEKRVYQGSSGKVYPYPVIDKIEDEKKPKAYRIVYLENEFLHIQIMPELGGRIYRALDKTNNYDFVYYNRVIKPALVGLAGPWISGGIEFNWPQHHRPLAGRYEEAKSLIARRNFHPWEGGEGKVAFQYVLCHVEIAKRQLHEGRANEAIESLSAALVYPDNIGEGKLAGAQENNIYYYLGCAWEQLGDAAQAEACYRRASQGLDEPSSAMFYNDQPPEMIFYQGLAWRKLGNEKMARSRFNKLVDYGEIHLFKPLTIDYFAVSLPDFLVFEDNLNRKNEVHCRFMMALGYLGLGMKDQAAKQFEHVLRLEPSHQGAAIHLRLCSAERL